MLQRKKCCSHPANPPSLDAFGLVAHRSGWHVVEDVGRVQRVQKMPWHAMACGAWDPRAGKTEDEKRLEENHVWIQDFGVLPSSLGSGYKNP